MREHEREFERCGLVTEILVDRSPVVAALPDREFALVLTTSAPAPLIYIEAFRRVIVIIQWGSCPYCSITLTVAWELVRLHSNNRCEPYSKPLKPVSGDGKSHSLVRLEVGSPQPYFFDSQSLKHYSSRHWSLFIASDMDPNTAEENGSHSLSVKKERDYETKTNDVS